MMKRTSNKSDRTSRFLTDRTLTTVVGGLSGTDFELRSIKFELSGGTGDADMHLRQLTSGIGGMIG